MLTFDLVTRLARALKISPIKLATYYWKDEEQEIADQNQEAVERIREFLTEYYQIGGHQQDNEPDQPPLPPLPARRHPISEKALTNIDDYQASKRRRKVEKPHEDTP